MPPRWRRRLLVLALVAAGVAVAVWAAMPQRVVVEMATVAVGDVVVEVVEDGRTRVVDRYPIVAPLGGDVLRIELDPGDTVQAGQIVARILPAEAPMLDARTRAEGEARLQAAIDAVGQARAAAEAAEVTAAVARRDADRIAAVTEVGGASRQDRDRAEAEARVAAEQLASARFAVDVAAHQADTAAAVLGRAPGDREWFDVASPVEGVVLRVVQEAAGPIQAGAPLLEVGDPRQLEVVVDVLSADAVRIRPGAPVIIERWGGDEALPAHVVRIEPSAVTKVSALGVEEQRVDVIAHLDAPRERWPTLGDGYRVEARIEVARADEALVVPEAAVFRWDGAHATFLVAEGVARRVPVDLGLQNGLLAEVISGLALGDRVVVHPSESVQDGVRVREP